VPDDILDQDMRPDDLVYVLQNLRFEGRDALGTVKLDRGVRDYLINAVRRHDARSASDWRKFFVSCSSPISFSISEIDVATFRR
jgi:hypothetical protein